MIKEKYMEARRKNNIFNNNEAIDAIEFVLDLIHAEKLHLETTEPTAYIGISRLESAWSELSSLASNLGEYMD